MNVGLARIPNMEIREIIYWMLAEVLLLLLLCKTTPFVNKIHIALASKCEIVKVRAYCIYLFDFWNRVLSSLWRRGRLSQTRAFQKNLKMNNISKLKHSLLLLLFFNCV